jgi:N-acetylglucosaminyldiphosphoundecaprenol N-acetyl-beta-D-mannosaminyltransferase
MNILGIKMDCISYEDMFTIFDEWLSHKSATSRRLAVINVHICVMSLFNKKLRDIYNSADLVGIDSMPFLKWGRLFYNRHSDHLNAPDILLNVSQKAKERKYRFFLYGGYPGAPEKIETYLSSRFEGINVVGKYSPPFRPLTNEEDDLLCNMINAVKPDFLWVGLGSPKQDIWIFEHTGKIQGSIIVPSGATFDFLSGRIKQAPAWIRKLGFEWLFRLTRDFKRLWVRYTVYNVIFLIAFFLQLCRLISFDQDDYLNILGWRSTFGNT